MTQGHKNENASVWILAGGAIKSMRSVLHVMEDGDVNIVALDTATKNAMAAGIASKPYFHKFENCDGSGGQKDENFALIKTQLPTILAKPEVIISKILNIVVTSLGGGSGSSILNHLVRYFLDNGLPFVIIGIESDEDATKVATTAKTLAVLRNTTAEYPSDTVIKSVKVEGNSYEQANTEIVTLTLLLTRLATNVFNSLDRADIKAWLNPTYTLRDPEAEGMLLELKVCGEDFELTDQETALAIVKDGFRIKSKGKGVTQAEIDPKQEGLFENSDLPTVLVVYSGTFDQTIAAGLSVGRSTAVPRKKVKREDIGLSA